MRHTKGHTGNRRSHHAIKNIHQTNCASCGAIKMAHNACSTCGMYRGRMVIKSKAAVVVQ